MKKIKQVDVLESDGKEARLLYVVKTGLSKEETSMLRSK